MKSPTCDSKAVRWRPQGWLMVTLVCSLASTPKHALVECARVLTQNLSAI
jgi:hypothetical protein